MIERYVRPWLEGQGFHLSILWDPTDAQDQDAGAACRAAGLSATQARTFHQAQFAGQLRAAQEQGAPPHSK